MTIKETTKKDSFFEERLVGGHHHKTDIRDTSRNIHVEARGRTPQEARERAWERYADKRSESK